MARQRIPRELRRRTWTEGTAWGLLVAADLLPYRFASPFADLGMNARERRALRHEEELLKVTNVTYILPQPATPRQAAQSWLYVRTKRGGYYRVGEEGEIERFGRHTQHLSSGSITQHGWYLCSLRGVRWLQIIATGLMVRKVNREQNHNQAASPTNEDLHKHTLASAPAEQLRLFP